MQGITLMTPQLNEQGSRLYIIGNGFDLYHGVASTYRDFEKYVKNSNNELYSHLQLYFDYDCLWSHFEAVLAEIDVESIQIESKDFIDSLNPDVFCCFTLILAARHPCFFIITSNQSMQHENY
jgi:hypothetical protein